METNQNNKRRRGWSPPPLLEQLRCEGQHQYVVELIRSFVYHTSARLQLLSDGRARSERGLISTELRNLKASCWQMEANLMCSICVRIESLESHSDESGERWRFLDELLREEALVVMHDMYAYALRVEKAQDLGCDRAQNASGGANGHGEKAHWIGYDDPLYLLWQAVTRPQGAVTDRGTSSSSKPVRGTLGSSERA